MLFLASSSASRKELLDLIDISYKEIGHRADESKCDWSLPIEKLVIAIAEYKMEHVLLPSNFNENEVIFVLSADTLSTDKQGEIHGKPVDREDAVSKIKKLRSGSHIYSAFCLDKLIRKNGLWHKQDRIIKFVEAQCIFDVPDDWIDRYLENSPALDVCGAIAIEGYGLQFLKLINGSYSTIIGLPLYELRQALEELDFFS